MSFRSRESDNDFSLFLKVFLKKEREKLTKINVQQD